MNHVPALIAHDLIRKPVSTPDQVRGRHFRDHAPDTLRMNDKPAKRKLHPTLKLALDFGPLVVFVITYSRFDIFVATAVFMATTVVAMAVSYALTRHVTVMLVVTSVVILVFGTLTLVLHDETFIK